MTPPLLQNVKLDNPQEWQLRDTARASNAKMVLNPLNANPKGFQNQYPPKPTAVHEEEEKGSFSEKIFQPWHSPKAWETAADDNSLKLPDSRGLVRQRPSA